MTAKSLICFFRFLKIAFFLFTRRPYFCIASLQSEAYQKAARFCNNDMTARTKNFVHRGQPSENILPFAMHKRRFLSEKNAKIEKKTSNYVQKLDKYLPFFNNANFADTYRYRVIDTCLITTKSIYELIKFSIVLSDKAVFRLIP